MQGQTIDAQAIVLRGPDGRVQLRIEATKHGPRFTMLDRSRRPRIEAIVVEHGRWDDAMACLRFFGSQAHGEPLLELGTYRNFADLGLRRLADDGDCISGIELFAESSDRDGRPRLAFFTSPWPEPILELPGPTANGRRGQLRRRLVQLMRELLPEGISRRELEDLVADAVWELVGFRHGGEPEGPRGSDDPERGPGGGQGSAHGTSGHNPGRCTAITQAGRRCKNEAGWGDTSFCWLHFRADKRPAGRAQRPRLTLIRTPAPDGDSLDAS